jgi:hypothetical protein
VRNSGVSFAFSSEGTPGKITEVLLLGGHSVACRGLVAHHRAEQPAPKLIKTYIVCKEERLEILYLHTKSSITTLAW